MNAPKRLDFTPDEIDALIDRLNNKCLQEGDYPLLTDILRAMIWLSFSLQEKELSIRRLRNIFGIKTESAKKLLELAQGKASDSDHSDAGGSKDDGSEEDSNEADPQRSSSKRNSHKNKQKNHGHRPSTDYSQAKIVEVAHQALKKGDRCPSCLAGRLFNLKSGTVLRIIGQPWLQMEIYKPERLRCSVCGEIFTARLPQEILDGSRADSSAKAIVCLLKYRGGVPFYRQGQMQEILGAPISASEIWKMTEDVADIAQSVYAALCKVAADSEIIHNDDTAAKIQSRMKELNESKDPPKRTGTFTTCIIATSKDIGAKVGLFFTGWKHAGENLDKLLTQRSAGLPLPIQECDRRYSDECHGDVCPK